MDCNGLPIPNTCSPEEDDATKEKSTIGYCVTKDISFKKVASDAGMQDPIATKLFTDSEDCKANRNPSIIAIKSQAECIQSNSTDLYTQMKCNGSKPFVVHYQDSECIRKSNVSEIDFSSYDFCELMKMRIDCDLDPNYNQSASINSPLYWFSLIVVLLLIC